MTNHLHPDHSCEVCQPLRPANAPVWGPEFGRRDFFRLASAGITGYFLSSILPGTASARPVGATLIGKARNCIFIHMQGAPSHVDTFDLKVGAWTPADFNPTAYNGVMFPQGLMPTLATHMDKLAIVRSVRAPALVHSLQQVWTQIARNPTSQMGRIAPNIGAVVSAEFEAQRTATQKLPGFIALNGGSVVGNGYFNPRYTPFAAAANPNGLAGLTNGDGAAVFDRRFQMLMDLDGGLRANSPLGGGVIDMDSFYQQSRGMMYNAEVDTVFKFSTEDQQRYGSTGFGNSCIVARNLVRANLGTRYIQIGIGGWDNHSNIYARPGGIYGPATQLDRGLGNLLSDLATTPGASGGTLLDETLIVAMGEFGRTVRSGNVVGLNNQQGRDHFFQHFVVFAGGGIKGGTIIGATTDDGGAVRSPGWSQNRNVTNEDIAATIYSALGIDYTTTRRDDPFGRGFEYVPFASEGVWYPILELFNTERARGSAQNPPPPAPAPRQRGGRRVDP